MKKIITTALIAVCSTAGMAQNYETDPCAATLAKEYSFEEMVSDADGKLVAPLLLRNIYAGVEIPVNTDGGLRPGWEIGVANVVGIKISPMRNGNGLTLGAGFGYHRVNTAPGNSLALNGNTLFLENPKGDDPHGKMEWWSFGIPVMWSQKISGNFGFSAGAILNFNTYATAASSYRLSADNGDITYSENYKGLKQRLFTVDLMASVGLLGRIGLYVKYSPMTVFQSGFGPKFSPLSVGVTLAP